MLIAAQNLIHTVSAFLAAGLGIAVFFQLLEASVTKKRVRRRSSRRAAKEDAKLNLMAGLVVFGLIAGYFIGIKTIGVILAILVFLGVLIWWVCHRVDASAVMAPDAEREQSDRWNPNDAESRQHAGFDPVAYGEKGENEVRNLIKDLPSNRYVVLNDVYLPMDDGEITQIDHIVVSRFGIFVIETKNWRGTIYGDPTAAKWTKFSKGCKSTFMNPLRQNYKHVLSILQKFDTTRTDFVRGIVALSPNAEFSPPRVPDGVVYFNGLLPWLFSHTTELIKPDQIPDIVAAFLEWSALVSPEMRAAHCRSGESV